MKAEKKFSVKAVIIGLVVDIGGSFGVGILIGIFAGIYLGVKGVSPDMLEEVLYSSFGFLLAILIIGLFFTGLGGYIAASIAKTAELKHALVVGLLSELLGIPFVVLSTDPASPAFDIVSLIFDIVSLILMIPIAVLGGYLAKSSRKEAPQ